MATSNRAKLLPNGDGEILKILRYAIFAVIFGCGGTGATVWARGESGFTPAGSVYRGRAIPALAGQCMFSDFCEHWLRTFKYTNGGASEKREWKVPDIGQVVSFGEDGFGETYVIGDKGVFRLTGLAK